MQTYIAHYISPAAADVRGTGLFEFESDSRANTKGNLRDARLKMLELYGKDAVSWTVDRVVDHRQRGAEESVRRLAGRPTGAGLPPAEARAQAREEERVLVGPQRPPSAPDASWYSGDGLASSPR